MWVSAEQGVSPGCLAEGERWSSLVPSPPHPIPQEMLSSLVCRLEHLGRTTGPRSHVLYASECGLGPLQRPAHQQLLLKGSFPHALPPSLTDGEAHGKMKAGSWSSKSTVPQVGARVTFLVWASLVFPPSPWRGRWAGADFCTKDRYCCTSVRPPSALRTTTPCTSKRQA